ncbi:hypothetical protein B566_EDAN014934 [Ephemera danica]|nr:hypothetical protein B566_EDAN014934 [Ephemera danica]
MKARETIINHKCLNSGEFKHRSSSVRLTGLTVVKGGSECESTLEGLTKPLQQPQRTGGMVLRSQHSAHSQTKITKMLLLVSTVFVCLNLPSYVVRLWVYVRQDPQDEERSLLIILQHASNLLFSTNFGINFVLYCVSGQNFRRALSALCWSGDAGAMGRRRAADISQTTGQYTSSTILLAGF